MNKLNCFSLKDDDGREGIDWIFEVHLKSLGDGFLERAKVLTFTGNEDYPDDIWVYEVDHYQASPIVKFVRDEEGVLVQQETPVFTQRIEG